MPSLTETAFNPPRGFPQWLLKLAEHSIGSNFQPDVASELRVFAATRSGGVILSAGTQVIPYVDWIQDGMPMDARLILHTQCEATAGLIRPHYSTDIRVATHIQDFSKFLSDIDAHRFDLVLIDADEITEGQFRTVVERVTDHGLLVSVGDHAMLKLLIQRFVDSHFCCWLGGSPRCTALSRKGLQHLASRRGGRRRRN